MTYRPTPDKRAKALDSIGATGERREFRTATLAAGNGVAYVAVDDWLPDPDASEDDPIQAEWPKVLEAASKYGKLPRSLPEPSYDNDNCVWVWNIPLD
jgi:hypothetical protein